MEKANEMVIETRQKVQKILQNSDTTTNDDEKSSIPPFFNNLKSIISFCHENQNRMNESTLGKDFLSLLDGRSKKYIQDKKVL